MKLFCPLRSVCLFSLFSYENKESLICLGLKKISQDSSDVLLIKMYIPKLHSAPLSGAPSLKTSLTLHRMWICIHGEKVV